MPRMLRHSEKMAALGQERCRKVGPTREGLGLVFCLSLVLVGVYELCLAWISLEIQELVIFLSISVSSPNFSGCNGNHSS